MRFSTKRALDIIGAAKARHVSRMSRKKLWHRSFATLPCYVGDGEWVWLDYVERRLTSDISIWGDFGWLYRPVTPE